MASPRTDSIIRQLRRAVLRNGAGLSDAKLLESFITDKDEAAFEALVRRHGRMVHGVCLRVLRNRHDAEDAFQATFLVLAHKAATVFPRDMLANWLYGVANTTALRARAAAARRRSREKQVIDMPEPKAAEPGQWEDLQPLLDQELTRLPDKYRIAIVLCDLEGRSRREVAAQLKIPEGTLSSRLTTARRLLAKRLSARGMAVSGGALAALLTQNALTASVPPTLVAATVKAVGLLAAGQVAAQAIISAPILALKEGVLKAMFLSKLKTVTTVLVMLGIVGFGGGLVAERTRGAQQEGQKSAPQVDRVPKTGAKPLPHDHEEKLNDFPATVDKPLETERPLSLREAIAIAMELSGAFHKPGTSNPARKSAAGENAINGQSEEDNDIARARFDRQRTELNRQMNNLLLNVEVAYWNLYAAYGTLYSNEEVLRVLHKLWMDTYVGAQAGSEKAPQDVLAITRAQFEEFRGERTNSLGAVLEAERNLRALMGLPTEDGKRLVPVTPPTLAKIEPNWEDALKDALSRRPELELARQNVRFRELDLADEKSSPEPKNRVARLRLAKAYYVLKDEEDKVKRTLTQQFQGVNKWYRLIEDRRAERKGYAEALKTKYTLVELSERTVNLDILDNQRRLALASTKECQAIAEYNNSLARLEFVRGTTMQRHNVVIGEKDLTSFVQVRAVLDEREKIESPTLPERPVGKHRVHLVTAQFEANCDRVTSVANSDDMILEGDVQLVCTRHGQPVRIQGERIQLHLQEGTFTVGPVSNRP